MILEFNPYLIVGIAVIAGLLALFLILFFMNKKTPVPKGCENLRVGEEACGSCQVTDCSIKGKLDIEKIKEDIEEEEE